MKHMVIGLILLNIHLNVYAAAGNSDDTYIKYLRSPESAIQHQVSHRILPPASAASTVHFIGVVTAYRSTEALPPASAETILESLLPLELQALNTKIDRYATLRDHLKTVPACPQQVAVIIFNAYNWTPPYHQMYVRTYPDGAGGDYPKPSKSLYAKMNAENLKTVLTTEEPNMLDEVVNREWQQLSQHELAFEVNIKALLNIKPIKKDTCTIQ